MGYSMTTIGSLIQLSRETHRTTNFVIVDAENFKNTIRLAKTSCPTGHLSQSEVSYCLSTAPFNNFKNNRGLLRCFATSK